MEQSGRASSSESDQQYLKLDWWGQIELFAKKKKRLEGKLKRGATSVALATSVGKEKKEMICFLCL